MSTMYTSDDGIASQMYIKTEVFKCGESSIYLFILLTLTYPRMGVEREAWLPYQKSPQIGGRD